MLPNTPQHLMTRNQFRQHIRKKRNAISDKQQAVQATQLVNVIKSLPQLKSASKVALYLTNDGEIDTHHLIEWCWKHGIQTYLPVIHPFSQGHLLFLHYNQHTPLVNNRYNILEPRLDVTKLTPCSTLDVIFTPLVGFDNHGHRIGMGGGYYDRTLAPWFTQNTGPVPIGLAHDCQHVEKLPIEAWDVPLPFIVTPSKIWHWENTHNSL
jgi:5-formyltetrahydrofolate cyclo-ligase